MKKFILASVSKAFLRRNTSLLQRRGIQLFTTTSGEEALDLHKECHFDLILTDSDLEDMDGFTLCSRVRKIESSKTVPVILTHHKFPGNLNKVEQSGVSAMLIKPIDPLELMQAIGKFTDLKMVRHKRVEIDVKVLIKTSGMELSCYSHDISNTGILLETGTQLALGSRITCQFTLPDSSLVEVAGDVIRSMSILQRKSLYGIKFIDLSLSCLRAIDAYVNLIANQGLVNKD